MSSENNIIKEIDLDVARKVNIKQAREYGFLPIKVEKDNVIVIAKEESQWIIEELKFIFSKKVIINKHSKEFVDLIIDSVFSGESEELINEIISKAIEANTSDIHFEPINKEVIIRFRIDGVLSLERKIKTEEYIVLLSKIKIKGNMDITEKRKPQDGKYLFVFNGKDYDLRLSTIPILNGEKLVVRILYGIMFNFSLENLNLTKNQFKKLKKIISLKNGLVIVNGPTGSGKSTTLYSILQDINDMSINITTLEDPVEVIINGINQMSLNKKVNIDFATGLKSILRQDPDVIMIGEIRDEETAKIAVRAALTGHKVYSTIHTKTPREVFLRLEDMGVKPYLIKDSLVGIISQRLIKILCEKCKIETEKFIFLNEKINGYVKNGCKVCNYTGYKGRRAVRSIYMIGDNEKKVISNIYQEINELNNYEMKENLDFLLSKGEISKEDYIEFLTMEDIDRNYDEANIS